MDELLDIERAKYSERRSVDDASTTVHRLARQSSGGAELLMGHQRRVPLTFILPTSRRRLLK